MHTEPRDSIPLRVVALNECLFGSGYFPHLFEGKKSAGHVLDRDSLTIFYLL